MLLERRRVPVIGVEKAPLRVRYISHYTKLSYETLKDIWTI